MAVIMKPGKKMPGYKYNSTGQAMLFSQEWIRLELVRFNQKVFNSFFYRTLSYIFYFMPYNITFSGIL